MPDLPPEDDYTPELPERLEALGGRSIDLGAPGEGENGVHIENAEGFVRTFSRAYTRGPRMVDILAKMAEDEDVEPRDRIGAAKSILGFIAQAAAKHQADAGGDDEESLDALAAELRRAKSEPSGVGEQESRSAEG